MQFLLSKCVHFEPTALVTYGTLFISQVESHLEEYNNMTTNKMNFRIHEIMELCPKSVYMVGK